MEGKEIKYEIKPKFNLLYEMGMPTGRKIRNAIFILVLFLIVTIITAAKANTLTFANYEIFSNIKVDKILLILCLIADIITAIKLVVNIVFQNLQYKHISYTFYDDMMVYEDDFLNQHRKNIEYKNIKEVEIRRTIWDRLLNYGIMVIYTNADNDRSNGLVVYSIKDPKAHYNIIDNLIHARTNENEEENPVIKNDDISKASIPNTNVSSVDNTSQKTPEEVEKDFKDSLKNINE